MPEGELIEEKFPSNELMLRNRSKTFVKDFSKIVEDNLTLRSNISK